MSISRVPATFRDQDYRFSPQKRTRQIACDYCGTIKTWNHNRLPELDGLYLHINEQPKGKRTWRNLQNAYKKGWNATWWCTRCWASQYYKHTDIEEPILDDVRRLLGIVKQEDIDWAGEAKRKFKQEDIDWAGRAKRKWNL
jgi:hypothetical protein